MSEQPQTQADKELRPRIPTPGGAVGLSQDTVCRPPARHVLVEHITYLMAQQRDLEIILNMIPANPTPEQDEALFRMFLKVRNTK